MDEDSGKYTGTGNSIGAKRTLKNYGFKNVKRYCGFGFDNMEIAKQQLRGEKLVFLLGAYPLSNGLLKNGGHAFVLDGLYSFNGNCHFHINWGWNGVSDGYYVCGIFDTRKRVSSDANIDNNYYEQSSEIGWLFRMVTYDK